MSTEGRRWLWIVLVVTAGLLLSLELACATPFAALAAVAVLSMTRRDAVAVTITAWLANQAVGFGVLGYPRDVSTVAWGVALGVAGLATLAAASVIAGWLRRQGDPTVALATFSGAFAVYQAVLFSATAVLPGGGADFSATIVLYVLGMNTISLAALLVLHRLGTRIGLAAGRSVAAPASVA